MKKSDNRKRESLKNLFLAFSEAITQDDELTNEVLEEEGLDPQKIGEEGAALFNKYLAKKKMSTAYAQKNNLMAQAKIKLIEKIKELGSSFYENSDTSSVIAGLFRDFQGLSEQDKKDIIQDQEVLKIIEEMTRKQP